MSMRTVMQCALLLGLFALLACDRGMMDRHGYPWHYWNTGRPPRIEESDAGAVAALPDAATPDASAHADAAPQPAQDAGASSTEPPKDPSVDGQCPSYIGQNGAPIWGCCSKFGVCGTFAANTCLLPVGTKIPLDPYAVEDGGTLPAGRCLPAQAK